MADAMKRWNGSQWVTVTSINRIEVGGGADLNIFNGLTAPETFDGVWFKTTEDVSNVVIEALVASGDGVWGGGAIMPYSGYGCGAIGADTVVYVGGGSSSGANFMRYNSATGVWSSTADFPYPANRVVLGEHSGKVYAFGGYNLKYNRVYDIATGTWSMGAVIPASDTSGGGCLKYGTKLIMVGNATCNILETTTGVWSTGAAMSGTATYLSGSSVSDKLYIAGGGLTYLRIYNAGTNVWTTSAASTLASRHAQASVGLNVYVMFVNGSSTAWRVYNTVTDTWTVYNNVPVANYFGPGASVGNKVYSCGGYVATNTLQILTVPALEYDPGTVILLSGRPAGPDAKTFAKILDNMTLCIENAWIYDGTILVDYETYVGDGDEWVKLKDAS